MADAVDVIAHAVDSTEQRITEHIADWDPTPRALVVIGVVRLSHPADPRSRRASSDTTPSRRHPERRRVPQPAVAPSTSAMSKRETDCITTTARTTTRCDTQLLTRASGLRSGLVVIDGLTGRSEARQHLPHAHPLPLLHVRTGESSPNLRRIDDAGAKQRTTELEVVGTAGKHLGYGEIVRLKAPPYDASCVLILKCYEPRSPSIWKSSSALPDTVSVDAEGLVEW